MGLRRDPVWSSDDHDITGNLTGDMFPIPFSWGAWVAILIFLERKGSSRAPGHIEACCGLREPLPTPPGNLTS
jgi:hypothetical protein